MPKKTREAARPRTLRVTASTPPALQPKQYITGPKLRAMLGIGPVTLWKWRHDPSKGFPAATKIGERLYFPLDEVMAWLERQPKAA